MKEVLSSAVRFAGVVGIASMLGACATPADSSRMTVGPAPAAPAAVASAAPAALAKPAPAAVPAPAMANSATVAPTAASPATSSGMTSAPAANSYPEKLAHAMCIRKLEGGEKTNPLWMSKVGNSEFQIALANSLERAGLLAPADGCKFPVDVHLLGISEPSMGFAMTATSNVNYKVFDSAEQPVLLETISAPYTAKMSESMIGYVRAKRANGFLAKLKALGIK